MTDWQEQAACAGMADVTFAEADPFFPKPDRQKSTREPEYDAARAICNSCPVIQECLRDAMEKETGELRDGMRGGTTPKERTALARHAKYRRYTPAAPHPNYLTPEQQQARRDAHAAGMSDYTMAEMFHVTPTTIRTWRLRHNLPTNNPDHSRHSSLATEETRKAMWRAGATDAEIGAAVGISQTAVGKWRNTRQLRVNPARRVA